MPPPSDHHPHAADLAAALAPLPPPAAAWAYGSAVFAQPGLYKAGNAAPPPMVDFLLAVPDPAAWHAANLAANPHHYTGWAARTLLGGRGLAWLAEAVGAGVHFNTGLAWPGGSGAGGGGRGRSLKYGVTSLASLSADLGCWDRLYAAGRLHKPALRVVVGGGGGGRRGGGTEDDDDADDVTLPAVPGAGVPARTLAAGQDANRAAAAAAALLTLPPRFTLPAFRAAVVGLSYTGDVRTAVRAEDGAKVARIAAGAAGELDRLYLRHLAGAVGAAGGAAPLPSLGGGGGATSASTPWVQDPRPAARAALAARLPPALAARVVGAAGVSGAPDAAAAVAAAVELSGGGRHDTAARLVRAALAATVRASSARAAVAGLVASGPGVAAWYVARKVGRAWGSAPI